MKKTTLADGRRIIEVCPRPRDRFSFIILSIAIFCGLYLTSGAYSREVYPQEVGHTLNELEEVENDEHFLVEYYAPNSEGNTVRHVRTLNIKNAELIEGTARDFGIVPSDLLSICIQEGSVANPNGHYYACDPEAVGDNGWAHGAFQINRAPTANPNVSIEDAKHLYFSARWTAERLIRKGYKNNRVQALQKHNRATKDGSTPYGDRILQIGHTLTPISI